MAGTDQTGYLVILIAMLSTGQSCPKPGHEKALRAVLRFMLLHMNMSQNFPHLDLRTFLRRTSVWKCIVMLDLPLCKLCRGEALLVVIVFRRVVLSVFLDIRHL